jgi:hypothetical protein
MTQITVHTATGTITVTIQIDELPVATQPTPLDEFRESFRAARLGFTL